MRDRSAPLTAAEVDGLAWHKVAGLMPAVVQDAATLQVLMLGYMDKAALQATLSEGYATFYSRSKARLWRKGETSGNSLRVQSVHADCDHDALLVLAAPDGPTCHVGTTSCFSEADAPSLGWLGRLTGILRARVRADPAASYTARLIREGPVRVAQKVGEEGVELALAAAVGSKEACVDEAADLVYHLTLLMLMRDFGWEDVANKLSERHRQSPAPDGEGGSAGR